MDFDIQSWISPDAYSRLSQLLSAPANVGFFFSCLDSINVFIEGEPEVKLCKCKTTERQCLTFSKGNKTRTDPSGALRVLGLSLSPIPDSTPQGTLAPETSSSGRAGVQ